jgi:predicted house-cleaning noncanonical NTP pyrophosphatase (MazG superfamily)
MKHESLWRTGWERVVVWLVVGTMVGALAAQEPPPTPETDPPERPVAGEAAQKLRGRLPAYYAKVVSDKQREEIYGIQAKYNAQIAKLKEQLDELTKKRDTEVEEVLSDEQRAEIARMKSERRTRAGSKASQEAEAEGG